MFLLRLCHATRRSQKAGGRTEEERAGLKRKGRTGDKKRINPLKKIGATFP
jgi:hypothetical protein